MNVAAIKNAASGRWVEILTTLGGIPAELLDGKHHPCPKCGGADRFRLIDAEAGAVLCNQCFDKGNGDGIAALQWLTDKPFPAVVNMVGDYLGMPSANGDGKANNGKAKRRPIEQLERSALPEQNRDTLIHTWTKTKPPITLDGAKRCGAEFVRWCSHRCVALFGFHQPSERSDDPAAVILYRQDGRQFAATPKLPVRKIHTVGGSKESWVGSGTVDELQAARTILKLEGPSDLMALVSAGLPDGHYAVTNVCGAKSIGNLDYSYAAGKGVLIIGDADTPGQNGAKRFARAFLKAGAADVRIPQLPCEITPDHGKDLRDWLAEGHTATDFLALVEATPLVSAEEAESWKTNLATSKNGHEIVIGTDEERVTDEAIQALATRPEVYQRAGVLVHVVREAEAPKAIIRPQGAPQIAILPRAVLREKMASAAVWLRPSGENETEPCHPPDWSVKATEARGRWKGIRRLEAVVESPILRIDGTVLQQPGYDLLTGILYDPQKTFPHVPERPTLADTKRAVDELLEVVEDVPFASDNDRAAWLAAAITPMARYAFTGPAPLNSIESNVRGAGKSLCADVIGVVNTGRNMARASAPEDNQEARKLITTIAISGERLILLDNVAGVFGCAALDAALTAVSWTDRILGTNRMVTDVPLNTVWFVTGNNIQYAADTARRVLPIRIESLEECPEERSGFHHPDLLAWVREQRPRLVVAGLTILRAFHAAGRPRVSLKPWGSFEGWSAAVRAPLVWCGLPDPAAGRQNLRVRADTEASFLRRLLDGWEEIDPDATGMTISKAVKLLESCPDKYQTLRAALAELPPPRGAKAATIRSIGMKFSHLRRRVAAGRFIDSYETRLGVAWLVGRVERRGTSGTSGTNSYSLRGCGRGRAHTRERTRG